MPNVSRAAVDRILAKVQRAGYAVPSDIDPTKLARDLSLASRSHAGLRAMSPKNVSIRAMQRELKIAQNSRGRLIQLTLPEWLNHLDKHIAFLKNQIEQLTGPLPKVRSVFSPGASLILAPTSERGRRSTQWLAGDLLRDIYFAYFKVKPTGRRDAYDDGKPYGPYLQFATACLDEMGIDYSPEGIMKAGTVQKRGRRSCNESLRKK
jgi:hypothetical protein